ncbi:hypothetical protein [Lysinibacillus sp. RS5]|uniref:hypothetical protein n=1 Tax=unclassified Lysinibacillus TaxID=2636778 RepID=UPI0035BE9DA4
MTPLSVALALLSVALAFRSIALASFRRFDSSFHRSDTSFRRFSFSIRRPGLLLSLDTRAALLFTHQYKKNASSQKDAFSYLNGHHIVDTDCQKCDADND